ncbi:MAG: hypothetical protein ACRDOK_23815 [Streptosporangiaceae bacterium]
MPPQIPADKVAIIPPSIDPFSPRNRRLDAAAVLGVLATIGVLDGEAAPEPVAFTRRDGSVGHVRRHAEITGDGRPGPEDPPPTPPWRAPGAHWPATAWPRTQH